MSEPTVGLDTEIVEVGTGDAIAAANLSQNEAQLAELEAAFLESGGDEVQAAEALTEHNQPVFHPSYNIDDITPADYNPRFLSETAFQRLQKSIDRFGFVKPIIVNGNGTILAGHQRTKASKALGLEQVPAIVLGVHAHRHDEIQFNLLHNSIEESGSFVVVPPAKGRTGFHWIDPKDGTVADIGTSAVRVMLCGKMLMTYGGWGSIIAHPVTGRVLLNSDYAVACIQTRTPMLCYYPPVKDAAGITDALSGDYGIYDATQVAATPYVQNVVQPNRLRTAGNGFEGTGAAKSAVWQNLALPRIKKGKTRILDFGAGNADYSKRLDAQGYGNNWYEPFYMDRSKADSGFDVRGSVTQLRKLTARVEKEGLYDLIVLDSVLNATSDDNYHDWVLRACAALLAPDGLLCLGTRALEAEHQIMKGRTATQGRRVTYLDPDGREVLMWKGVLLTMKYHTKDTLVESLGGYFGEVQYQSLASATHLVLASAPRPQVREELLRALTEEFNPPYPNEYRHNRHEKAVAAVLAANEAAGKVLEVANGAEARAIKTSARM